MKKLFKSRRATTLMIILVLILAAALYVFLRRWGQRNRARKIDAILEECRMNPDCRIGKGGKIEEPSDEAKAGRKLSDSQASAMGRQLVDDIWGFTWNYTGSLWKRYRALGDGDFRGVTRYADANVIAKKDDDIPDFYTLVFEERDALNTIKKDKITKRMQELGIS